MTTRNGEIWGLMFISGMKEPHVKVLDLDPVFGKAGFLEVASHYRFHSILFLHFCDNCKHQDSTDELVKL
jgi:hypothetical protein